jgi:hypothetical protein
MPETCQHCGATLPTVVDAFCPECRRPLDEPPHQGRDDGAAADRRWTRRLALAGATLGFLGFLNRLPLIAGAGLGYVVGYMTGSVVIPAAILAVIGRVIDRMRASRVNQDENSN